jgi:hypothetical protein
MTLEDLIASLGNDAAVLRLHGHPAQAAKLDQLADDIRAAVPEHLAWLSEADARLYSGRGVEYLRGQFHGWERRGLAEWRGKHRFFRRCVLPHRGNLEAARLAGERAVA